MTRPAHCACGCTGCGAAEPDIDMILSAEPIFSDWTKRYWGGDKDRFQPMVHVTIEDYRDRLRKRAMEPAQTSSRPHEIEAIPNSGGAFTHYCHVCGAMGVGLMPSLPCPGPKEAKGD